MCGTPTNWHILYQVSRANPSFFATLHQIRIPDSRRIEVPHGASALRKHWIDRFMLRELTDTSLYLVYGAWRALEFFVSFNHIRSFVSFCSKYVLDWIVDAAQVPLLPTRVLNKCT